jgi:hypothetical protein
MDRLSICLDLAEIVCGRVLCLDEDHWVLSGKKRNVVGLCWDIAVRALLGEAGLNLRMYGDFLSG